MIKIRANWVLKFLHSINTKFLYPINTSFMRV